MKCETKLQGVEGLKDRLAPINLGPRSSPSTHTSYWHQPLKIQNTKYNTNPSTSHYYHKLQNPLLVIDLKYQHHRVTDLDDFSFCQRKYKTDSQFWNGNAHHMQQVPTTSQELARFGRWSHLPTFNADLAKVYSVFVVCATRNKE